MAVRTMQFLLRLFHELKKNFGNSSVNSHWLFICRIGIDYYSVFFAVVDQQVNVCYLHVLEP